MTDCDAEGGQAPHWFSPAAWQAGMRPQDLRNARVVNMWCCAWALAFVGATFLISRLQPTPIMGAVIIAVPLVIGVCTIRSYLRFLHQADELLRKVHLQGLGVGSGAAMAVGSTFLMAAPMGASALWGLTFALAALALSFSFSVLRAARRLNA
ncbi:hypothetical protein GCM10009127_02190 [Alteraurantiacibacter aestuarii]|uniref:Uncharacterized protein n=1 Tax=Alteraurantiacibacter aestuarii TaxID=650004 RepID=A0A844ZNX7_9SPHN|nr:hypothetical protein [Alteraurantiacibacter aestuarii]MXO88527.1 hypothetical protein [Alteraurantiacibacter aestuarii]